MKFKLIALLLIILIMVGLSGCRVIGNSGNLSEGLTEESNTFNYILVKEADDYYLHEINKWKDGESEAVGVTTKCCNNQFWTSYNQAVMYTNFPEDLAENVIICND